MYKKPLIVFEGIEGSGKSSHINYVSNYLKKKNYKFIKIREPGGSINSEKIRKLILDKKSLFNSRTDLLLYLAARSENLSIIKKNYKKKIILIDRFVDSTIAYQHYGMKLDLKFIQNINDYLLKGIKIDITFLHTVSHFEMIKRLKERKNLNRYDQFNKSFYINVQKGFLKLSRNKNKKYQIIDSHKTIDYNKELIIEKISKLIK